jgi:hypothetical protein
MDAADRSSTGELPQPDRGNSPSEVMAFIDQVIERQRDRSEEGSLAKRSGFGLAIDEYNTVFERLNIGFVLLDSRRMDSLLQEVRVARG